MKGNMEKQYLIKQLHSQYEIRITEKHGYIKFPHGTKHGNIVLPS